MAFAFNYDIYWYYISLTENFGVCASLNNLDVQVEFISSLGFKAVCICMVMQPLHKEAACSLYISLIRLPGRSVIRCPE